MTTDTDEIVGQIAEEIRRFHNVLHDFYRGTVDRRTLETSMGVHLSEDFSWVSPDGEEFTKSELLERWGENYGTNPDLCLWVEDFQLITRDNSLVVLKFIKKRSGKPNIEFEPERRATAIFSLEPELRWVQLFETYMTTPLPYTDFSESCNK